MTKEEALKILQKPIADFNVGDCVYYARHGEKVIKAIITAKRESKIGLPPCYSLRLYINGFGKTVHIPQGYIFNHLEDALKCVEAVKFIKKNYFKY